MSLSTAQQQQTSRELRENLRRSGLSEEAVATALGRTAEQVRATLDVSARSHPADVWALRDFLESTLAENDAAGVPYSVLTEQMRSAAVAWFGIDP